MKPWLFWTCWGIDALIGAIAVIFFLIGLADGSVSSFNIGIWMVMLAVLAVILGGSLWLKEAAHPVLAMLLLLVLAIPGVLSGLFLFLLLVTNARWN